MMKKLLILLLALHYICYAQNAEQDANYANISYSLIKLREVDKAVSFLENSLKLEFRREKKSNVWLYLLTSIKKIGI